MRKALLIGIDDYMSSKTNLNCCVNDMLELSTLLERHSNGAVNFDVQPVANIKGKNVFLDYVRTLFKNNDEIALLFYSGHGSVDKDGCGCLAIPETDGSISLIRFEEITRIANQSPAINKIIILDSCFSGGCGEIKDCCMLGDGVTILSACRKDECSVEDRAWGHGLFTKLLCEALKGSASSLSGEITMGNIYSYIDRMLGAWQQRPIFKTNVSSFVPVRKSNPTIDLSIIRQLVNWFTSVDSEFSLDSSFEVTNDPDNEWCIKNLREPYANPSNVSVFKQLQKLESVGLVAPVDEEHMFFAAMKAKSCRLTELGQYYWRLVKAKKI